MRHIVYDTPQPHVVWRDDFGILCACTWGLHVPFTTGVVWRGMARSVFEAIALASDTGGGRVYVVEMTSAATTDHWLPWEVYLTAMGGVQSLERLQRHPGVCQFRLNTFAGELS